MIGLKTGIVKLLPSQPEWKHTFQNEKWLISSMIQNWVMNVEHIGSTAVPGLVAKPIIDILVGLNHFKDAIFCIQPLEMIDYEFRAENGETGRLFFRKGSPRICHLHLVEWNSVPWRKHIIFRDCLRTDPKTLQAYADLKKHLTQKFPTDREKYTINKTEFIQSIVDDVLSKESGI